MEPQRQIEIQLGHMCNNRCVFCVSGQRTEQREALPIAGDPIVERLREARAQGIGKVTLLGGEPTIQPDFLPIVRAAVDLGFDEIVVFTNGVKTARGSFVDELLETGGRFVFRLSFQGATARAHERTTKKLGSFQRLVETMQHLRARGQRISVNMCVVRSNYESVGEFPALLLPFGVEQLHLDMVRPLDAGVRTEDELRAMMPRYSDLVPHLERMVAGFPAGFDVNVGNLPYCVAPSIAHVIHHDGEQTLTIAVDQKDDLSEPWDKYEVKKRDKLKLESCRACVFDDACSGVFDTYRRFHGVEELVPVTRARLRELDPELRLFTLHAAPLVDALRAWTPPPPFSPAEVFVDSRAGRVAARFSAPGERRVELEVRRPGGGAAGTDAFSLHLTEAPLDEPARAETIALLRALFDALCAASGARVRHGVGADAPFHGPLRARAHHLDGRIGVCLERLRRHAPFEALRWEDVSLDAQGREATVTFRHDDGVGVAVAFAVVGDGVRGGYKLDRPLQGPPPRSLVEGVRAALAALRG